MTRRNRKTLKNFFQKGQMPTEEHFSDLIDSMVNIVDEGISKSINRGLELSSVGESSKLISFYKNIEDSDPDWSLDINKENLNISFNNRKDEKLLTLDDEGRVGIAAEKPRTTLEVGGVVSFKGRTGTYKIGQIPADRKWHPILTGLEGCHAFEIVAGVGNKQVGKYALMNASVMNSFYSHRNIFYHHSFFKTIFCKKFKLRWRGTKHSYSLEMRTKHNYGTNIYANYSVGQLWFDTFMDNCTKQ